MNKVLKGSILKYWVAIKVNKINNVEGNKELIAHL